MSLILDGTNGVTFNDSSLQAAAASPYVLKNKLINGAMVIDQRNAGASVTPGGTAFYTLDRWQANMVSASKFSVQQNAGSVTPPAGFTNYLGVTSLFATTVGTSDYYFITQTIEGYNVADFAFGTANAKTITLSFWVRSSLTGTFGGALRNSGASRSYPFSYTISSANTWTQISITISGDTTGTWLTTNGLGMDVNFSLGMGSTYSGTAGAWAGTNYASSTGAVNMISTNGATWYITGVQLEIGSTATPFERRLYNQELANCQRYYEVLTSNSNTVILASSVLVSPNMWTYWYFKQNKRVSPTIALTANGSWVNQTPSIYPSIETSAFQNGTAYFYLTGTNGLPLISASAEL